MQNKEKNSFDGHIQNNDESFLEKRIEQIKKNLFLKSNDSPKDDKPKENRTEAKDLIEKKLKKYKEEKIKEDMGSAEERILEDGLDSIGKFKDRGDRFVGQSEKNDKFSSCNPKNIKENLKKLRNTYNNSFGGTKRKETEKKPAMITMVLINSSISLFTFFNLIK